MKIKNIAFFGVMASILSVAGAHAATTQTIIASKNYVDGKITGINTTLSETYATKGYANTAASNAQSAAEQTAAADATSKANAAQAAAEQTAAADATSKANAARTNAVADVKTNLENTTTPVYDINAKSLKVNGTSVLTSHQSIAGKANTDLNNITSAGNTVIQNQAKSVAANGTFSASTNYTDGTIGAAIKSKADTSAIPTKVSDLTNDSSFATTTQVATAKSEAISAADTDATTKANAARTNAVADVKTNLENTTTPVYDINAKSLKVNGASVLTSHQSIAGKANTDLTNLSTTGKANVSAQGTYSASANYTDGTVGAAIKGKVNVAQGSTNKNKILITDNNGDVTTATSIANTQVSGLGSLATKSTIASADITDGTIVNADVSTSAAIAYTKMAAPTVDINGGTSVTCSSADPCVLSYDGSAYSWTKFVY